MRLSVVLGMLGVVVGLGISGVAQSKGERTMSALVTHARYVMVRTMAGEAYASNITPEDRQAIAEVEKKIEQWGRYKLAYKQQDAEIILVVRRGAFASAKPGVIIGGGTGRSYPSAGVGLATETGPKDDMIAVYDATNGIDGTPLWRKFQKGGLLNEMPLFKEFKAAVEKP